MNERPINNDSTVTAIPVEFWTDVPLALPVKIQLQNTMDNPLSISEKPLIPALFQISACIGESESKSVSRFKNFLAQGRTPLAETMLNPDKIEEILKGVAHKKKSAARRMDYGRFHKNLA